MSKARDLIEATLSSELSKDVTISSKNGRVKINIIVDGENLEVSVDTDISGAIPVNGSTIDIANFHSLNLLNYLQDRNFDIEFRTFADDLDASLKVLYDKIRKSLQRHLANTSGADNAN